METNKKKRTKKHRKKTKQKPYCMCVWAAADKFRGTAENMRMPNNCAAHSNGRAHTLAIINPENYRVRGAFESHYHGYKQLRLWRNRNKLMIELRNYVVWALGFISPPFLPSPVCYFSLSLSIISPSLALFWQPLLLHRRTLFTLKLRTAHSDRAYFRSSRSPERRHEIDIFDWKATRQ